MCGGNLSVARSKALQGLAGPTWGHAGTDGAMGTVSGVGIPNNSCSWSAASVPMGSWGIPSEHPNAGMPLLNSAAGQPIAGSLEAAFSGLGRLGGVGTQMPYMSIPPAPTSTPSCAAATMRADPKLQVPLTARGDLGLPSTLLDCRASPLGRTTSHLSSNCGGVYSPMTSALASARWSGSSTDHERHSGTWSTQDTLSEIHSSADSGAHLHAHSGHAVQAHSGHAVQAPQRNSPSAPGGAVGAAPEVPPPGCDPDAIKLFVGNIPKTLPEPQLMMLLELVGKVVQLEIKRARFTHIAFVWYEKRVHAEQAILHFKAMRHVLPGLNEGQERPLVVRRAKLRPTKASHKHSQEQAASGGFAGLDLALLEAQALFGEGAGEGEDGFAWLEGAGAGVGVRAVNCPPSRQISDLLCSQQVTKEQARRCFSQDLPSRAPTLGFGSAGGFSFDLTGYGGCAPVPAPAAPAEPVTVPLTPQQLATVNGHVLQMVETVSGAQVAIQSGQLVIRGTSRQVESARSMIHSVVG